MLISSYGRTTCLLQVGSLWALSIVVSGGLAAAGLGALAPLGAIPAAVGLFVLSFYRDPERSGAADPALCLSPADGRVTDLVEVDEPQYLGGRAFRVGIFLSPLNVHVNRSPLAGEVEAVVHTPGKCLPATGTSCVEENESSLLGLRVTPEVRVAIRQVTGALARTIVNEASAGQRLERGERYGMIKLGSRTELLIPVALGFEPSVQIGDGVRGGETVLGRIPALASAAQAAPEPSEAAL